MKQYTYSVSHYNIIMGYYETMLFTNNRRPYYRLNKLNIQIFRSIAQSCILMRHDFEK